MKGISTINIGQTREALIIKLLRIFQHHVGLENAISKTELFRKCYGINPRNDVMTLVKWDYIRHCLSYVRKTTYCFVVPMRTNEGFYYYVPSNKHELKQYDQMIDKFIEAFTRSKQRALESVNKKWYKKNFLESHIKELENKR